MGRYYTTYNTNEPVKIKFIIILHDNSIRAQNYSHKCNELLFAQNNGFLFTIFMWTTLEVDMMSKTKKIR